MKVEYHIKYLTVEEASKPKVLQSPLQVYLSIHGHKELIEKIIIDLEADGYKLE